MEKEKKSIIKEALTDYNEIMMAADANAKKKLAEEFPEKFKNILKEELNKNKSAKESYKKIDEAKESVVDNTEEKEKSVMKKQVKETEKVKEQAGEGKPFSEKAKEPEKVKENVVKEEDEVVNEEREKDFMGDLESDTPNQAKEEKMKKGEAFTKKVDASSGKPMANKVHEGYDMTEMDADTVDRTIDAAGDEDEFLTIDDIEAEIAKMEGLEEELETVQEGEESDPFNELIKMRNQLDEMISKLGGVVEQKRMGGQQNFAAREKMGKDGGHAGVTGNLIDEEEVDEQKRLGGKQSIPGREQGGPTKAMIDEEPISDADVEAVLNQKFGGDEMGDDSLDETLPHPITHSNARHTGAQNHTNYGKESRLRHAMREGDVKKVQSLINENKKLVKKLNETKKYRESVTTLVENYKNALEKYRNQLKEMAVFNTNLAHVNNLLVNEEFALTQEDKIKIINEFKTVNTITDSQNKYKSFLTEMKESKKTITEGIEKKVNTSIQPSSKQKLDEVVEKTAYENNEHLDRMKKIIETIERGDKKKKII